MMLGSQAGDGAASLTPGITRPRLHPITLSFREREMEAEYERFFLEKHQFAWRRTMYLLFSAGTCLYAYVMIRSPTDGENWEHNYSREAKGSIMEKEIGAACPPGWFCMQCDPDYICNAYHLSWDLAFWICSILMPCLLLVIASYRLRPVQLARFIHLLSSIFILAYAGLGLIVRYEVVEPMTPVFQPALICIMLIFVSCMFMRLRFIYTVVSISIIVVLFFAIYAPHVANDPVLSPSTAKTYVMSVLALLVSGVVASFNTYETEVFNRAQFLASYTLQKTNAKLTNQLKVLQKAYGNKVADLDSPLEKSVMLLRSMMADPSNSPAHLVTIGQILTLLASSNLLAPDLENQVGELLDNEQEQWLFTEIAPRRKTRNRLASRRRSITADISAKIDMPIAESVSNANIMASSSQSNAKGLDTISRDTASVERVSSGTNMEKAESANAIVERIKQSRSSVASAAEREKSSSSPVLIAPAGAFLPVNDDYFNPSPEVALLLAKSTEFNWPIFDFLDATKGKPLSVLSFYLFKRADLFSAFNIPVDIFRNFISAIENGYRTDLPYHNSIHASDVLQCTNYFLFSNDNISKVAGDIDLLSIYVAAIIHDHDHPGFNNNFLVNTYDTKAIMYNDRSVLENHHLASAFSVMNKPENNFLCNLSKSDFRSVREAIIEMVLATDLSQHFPLISMFKSKVSSNFDPYETREDRMLLWKILIKCADVSNPTKSWTLYERWCRLILEEFFRQGDLEKRMGLQVSPYMDRDNLNIPSSQSGFIEFVVLPLFEAYDKWAPIPPIMVELQRNREFWIMLKSQGVTTTIPASGPSGSLPMLGVPPQTAPPPAQQLPPQPHGNNIPPGPQQV
ncbi:uncharacterized protein SPPG_05773 [Spizellomyces punctatus DAOM BR117]|uniref:PDEase domain-containing protein n=1 Tax=Spizellomyces punctatus (strain DAOM BR117) TaxID=645134 RepID=A0A0L0HCT6_SPIPD|nr:uncharacterized protein SPPG_05773 [Spizellomyces punctatus DAOM BR117]KNC98796.1 hypothetical protein SPPG_05773 [Spizellomyces punctatus DAOM BR117]|eukprot:XP_016606836.1 hypothetical protein SPPG_05773 [Spizellomyces punctatus DAOM BR117]